MITFIKIFINANNAYIYVSFFKSSFEGLSGPSPYPYPSNQKRIETPYTPSREHAKRRGRGKGKG